MYSSPSSYCTPYPHSPKKVQLDGTGQVVQNQTVAHSLLSDVTAIFTPSTPTHFSVHISVSPVASFLFPPESC